MDSAKSFLKLLAGLQQIGGELSTGKAVIIAKSANQIVPLSKFRGGTKILLYMFTRPLFHLWKVEGAGGLGMRLNINMFIIII